MKTYAGNGIMTMFVFNATAHMAHPVFGISLFVACGLIACNTPVDKTSAYWAYRGHVDRYDVLTSETRKVYDTSSVFQREISDSTDALIGYVERMENALLDSVDQPDIRKWDRDAAPPMDKLLEYKVTTEVLIGKEPAKPKLGPLSAEALAKLIDRHVRLLSQISGMEKGFFTGLPETGNIHSFGTLDRWSNVTFYHLPLIHALDELNAVKIALRQVELQLFIMQSSGIVPLISPLIL